MLGPAAGNRYNLNNKTAAKDIWWPYVPKGAKVRPWRIAPWLLGWCIYGSTTLLLSLIGLIVVILILIRMAGSMMICCCHDKQYDDNDATMGAEKAVAVAKNKELIAEARRNLNNSRKIE